MSAMPDSRKADGCATERLPGLDAQPSNGTAASRSVDGTD